MTATPIHDDSSNDEDMLEVPEQFICPITQELMKDPVVTKYGQSYERAAILEWIAKGKDCPLTRQPLSLSGIITNHSLRSQIRSWQVKNELDITLVTNDPMERMGMYFLCPFKEIDETERTTDDEQEEIREVRAPQVSRPGTRSSDRRSRRRRVLLRLLNRGTNRTQN